MAPRLLIAAAVLACALFVARDGVTRAGPVVTADFVVDTNVFPCIDPNIGGGHYFSIQDAVDGANTPGMTIYVCPGTYPEHTITMDVDGVDVFGPGATPADDGVATVTKSEDMPLGSDMFYMPSSADGVKIRGLTIDGTPPAGWPNAAINPIRIEGGEVEILDNIISHAFINSAVRIDGDDAQVMRNKISDSIYGGFDCDCERMTFRDNEVGPNVGGTGMTLVDDDNVIEDNEFVEAPLITTGSGNAIIDGNTFDMGGENLLAVTLSGQNIIFIGNTVKSTTNLALSIQDLAEYQTSVSVHGNTFQDTGTAIELYDNPPITPNQVTAEIGGETMTTNIFRNNTSFINNYLENDINAEYNDWGVCSLAEIEAKVTHDVDQASRGLVDFSPFVPGPTCATPTPTPSPTPSPSLTASPTTSATVTPTSSVTASASASTTPAPTPYQSMRGDMNCDGQIKPRDALDIAVDVSGIPVDYGSCPAVGGPAMTVGGGGPYTWGDVDCDDDIDLDDVIAHLAAQMDVPIPNPDNCSAYDNLGDVVG